ncbi:hypothetical protein [Herbaspirillum rhizosphaerae]|uniref:hypothetical protein n=1 Tax=Herbaspirillum rhizosphaerae TaxID=346179 RepID=UPI00067D4DA7|nr:hypothetical protein [Herbaspirillum rhizosphaerae]
MVFPSVEPTLIELKNQQNQGNPDEKVGKRQGESGGQYCAAGCVLSVGLQAMLVAGFAVMKRSC